jgi:hypothetical protein
MWHTLHKICEKINKAFFQAVAECGFGGLASLAIVDF